MSTRVCSNCGAVCGVDTRGGSVDYYLVCECNNPRHRVPGTYGGSRADTYDDNIFGVRPVPPEEFARKESGR